MEAQQHLSMRDYGRVIVRRYRVVIAFAILGLIAGLVMYFTAAKAYRASSEVLIERPSGYVISAAVGSLGTATSTKQQAHFIDTPDYQELARALTYIAPKTNLDLRDMATLDDISTVVQSRILSSSLVTPVRLALYNLPARGLYSFQQARTLKETPVLRPRLDSLAAMAMGPSFSVTTGWTPDHASLSDQAVRANIALLVESPLVKALAPLGVTDNAADDTTGPQDDEDTVTSLHDGAKLTLAANTIGILADLEIAAAPNHKPANPITGLSNPDAILASACSIMKSSFVASLIYKYDEGRLTAHWAHWPLPTSEADARQADIVKAGDALAQNKRQHPPKEEGVWDASGKEISDGTDIIAISQTAPSPDKAMLAANAMAAVMVWEDRMTKVADAERSARFLEPELAAAENTLRRKENEVTAFSKRHKVIDAQTQLKSTAEYAADLESQLGEAGAAIKETRATLAKTESQIGGTKKVNIFPTIKQNPIIESVKADLIRAETSLEGLRAKGFTEDWPDVMSAKAQVVYLRKSLDKQIHDSIERQYVPDPVHYALLQKAADLASGEVGLEARQSAVNRLLGQMNGQFASLPAIQADLVRLTRDRAIAEQQYTNLYGRLLDAKNNRAMRQGNARVIAVAQDTGEKVAPRKRNIFVGLLVGLFVGCVCALALSATDAYIRTVDDVRKELNVPVLAHLPALSTDSTLVVEAMPASAVTEAFRALRSSIRFLGTESPIRSLVVTSVRLADAKSAVVANLSASLAQAGLIITAVDADLRTPRLDRYFGSAPGPGLAEVLAGGAPASSARRSTRIPGLFAISAGTPPASSAELLETGHIGEVLAGLAEGNDMLVVDTPPVGAINDASVIGATADATILVIESGAVDPDAARSALARLSQSARTKVIGIVLVGGDAPIVADYTRYTRSVNNSAGKSQGRGKA